MRRALVLCASIAMLVIGSEARAAPKAECTRGSWAVLRSARVPSSGFELRGVSVVSRRDVWAVGSFEDADTHSSTPLVQHWDGDAWTTIETVPDGTVGSLSGVDGSARDDVWAVGSALDLVSGSEALATHWNGRRWRVVQAAAPQAGKYVSTVFTDVLVLRPRDAWAVGYWSPVPDASPSPLIEHWNGRAWRVVGDTDFGSWTELLSVSGTSSRNVWAVGNTEVQVGPTLAVERPLAEHWNGRSWRVVGVPVIRARAPGTFESVDAGGRRDAWTVGELTTRHGVKTFSMHWDGDDWQIVSTVNPSASYQTLASVSIASRHRVWAVGTRWDANLRSDVTLTERWDGSRWIIEPSANRQEENQLNDVDVLSSTNVAVGSYWANNGDGPQQGLVLERC